MFNDNMFKLKASCHKAGGGLEELAIKSLQHIFQCEYSEIVNHGL